mmetsp:Transcript_5879/g.36448  ORF Transcript_5879/g.36448 Transcript_5879/m.36448 type:complete len:219 (+) Transcript_5879:208-864(+)
MGVLLRTVLTLFGCGHGETLLERPYLVLVQLAAVIWIIVETLVPISPNNVVFYLSRTTQGQAHVIETHITILHQCKAIWTYSNARARISSHCAPLNQAATPFNAYCRLTICAVYPCVLQAELAMHGGHRQKDTRQPTYLTVLKFHVLATSAKGNQTFTFLDRSAPQYHPFNATPRSAVDRFVVRALQNRGKTLRTPARRARKTHKLHGPSYAQLFLVE